MLKVLKYLVLSICHSVGKIGTMHKIVVDKAREGIIAKTEGIIAKTDKN